ncbi:hypothetical protein EVAR_45029_1 [Eumeta japonica]|uniref:Reverse transcriptase domain-containing protein n=1 Tax=Eumeta variegata TaxID=151549 RepID=A0A4C1YQQ2_EUMVA|nr:hypothetical protein EVAR_45029_1 [Eumeta japonica]
MGHTLIGLISGGVSDRCVASLWLFNLFMDSCLYLNLKQYECGLRTNDLSVKCLLYANDQVIPAPSECELEIINKMNDSVKKRGMKVNVSKTKVAVFEEGEMRHIHRR